jgi:hypothetical protein
MESEGDSPFPNSYQLGVFTMAAFNAPAVMQLAIVDGRTSWIVVAAALVLWTGLSRSMRWVLVESAWFRRAMTVNAVVQVIAAIVAWMLDEKWIGAIGLGFAFILGAVVSLPWQSRLREQHNIPNRPAR